MAETLPVADMVEPVDSVSAAHPSPPPPLFPDKCGAGEFHSRCHEARDRAIQHFALSARLEDELGAGLSRRQAGDGIRLTEVGRILVLQPSERGSRTGGAVVRTVQRLCRDSAGGIARDSSLVAERGGFEPPRTLRIYTRSRRAP
jgi:hypothetical protein